jgi:acetyl-CoA carboxylase alpha subunit
MARKEIILTVRKSRKRGPPREAYVPAIVDLVRRACDNFVEFRQGKAFCREAEVKIGCAMIGGQTIAVLMIFREDVSCKSESPRREPNRLSGYSKIQHLFELAQKFQHPIVVFAGTHALLSDVERVIEPNEALRFAEHILSQSQRQVPMILVVLTRRASGDLFGAWLADKVLTLEESCLVWPITDSWPKRLPQLRASYLLQQGIIDGIIGGPVWNRQGSSVAMAGPRQLRIALEAMLEKLLCLSPQELQTRRNQKMQRISALASDANRVIAEERNIASGSAALN